MSEFDATDPQAGGNPSDDQQPSVEQLQEENKRLNSRLVTSENANRQADAVVNVSRAIFAAPGGKEIFARADKAMKEGKTLDFTQRQEAKLEKVAEAVGATVDDVKRIFAEGLANHEQSLYQSNRAEKAIAKLHEWGKKELEGYDGMYETDAFNRMVSHTLAALQPTQDANGNHVDPALPLPEGENDAYKYAIKHSHAMLTAGKSPPKKDTQNRESERRRAISGQQTTPAGGPTESEPDTPYGRWSKQRNTSVIGKSYSNPTPSR